MDKNKRNKEEPYSIFKGTRTYEMEPENILFKTSGHQNNYENVELADDFNHDVFEKTENRNEIEQEKEKSSRTINPS